jgi:hypothetical protein
MPTSGAELTFLDPGTQTPWAEFFDFPKIAESVFESGNVTVQR